MADLKKPDTPGKDVRQSPAESSVRRSGHNLPGRRAGVAPGTLPSNDPDAPQGDENRDQPVDDTGRLGKPIIPP